MKTPSFIASLSASWLGLLGTVAFNFHTALSVVTALVSIAGTLYAIAVARTELKRRRIQETYEALKLCAECRAGRRPPICPLDPGERPADCPHYRSGRSDKSDRSDLSTP